MHKGDAFSELVDPDRPLCCRYLLVVLDELAVPVSPTGECRQEFVCWALGVLANGEHEVLGLWMRSESDPSAWGTVSGELEHRGVARIDVTLGMGGELRPLAFSGIGVLPALSEPSQLGDLPAGVRRSIAAGWLTAQAMRTCAARAIRRAGGFLVATAAVSCVARALVLAGVSRADSMTPWASDRRSRKSGLKRTNVGSQRAGIDALVG